MQDLDYLILINEWADEVRAETFDRFLDHAKSYFEESRKMEAGAGVVFEDTIRRIAEKYCVSQKGEKLDDLISRLSSEDVGVLTKMEAKTARTAAHVRTKSTHAQWDEFTLPDVERAINFTEELVEKHFREQNVA
ncbi:MAG: hypothetical protein DMG13_00795 [Acidobacteria bacterium]|nr:MAG: hypothetical protein DMG13_00795 [Acidobacteriota bacterium]